MCTSSPSQEVKVISPSSAAFLASRTYFSCQLFHCLNEAVNHHGTQGCAPGSRKRKLVKKTRKLLPSDRAINNHQHYMASSCFLYKRLPDLAHEAFCSIFQMIPNSSCLCRSSEVFQELP